MPLEQKCVQPGEWLIEGYTVTREQYRPHGGGALVRWRIKGWEGHPAGAEVLTLDAARDWIRRRQAT